MIGEPVIGNPQPSATPQDAFLLAQAAVLRGDWEGFFPLIVHEDLERLAQRGVMATTCTDGSCFRGVCLEHGITVTDLDHLQHLAQQVSSSAERILHGAGLDAEGALLHAMGHRELVRAQAAALATCVESIDGLASFVATAEHLRRELDGAGSISSTIFLDEALLDVAVTENRAIGIRRRPLGIDEPITFERCRGTWQIQLFDDPPA